MEWMPSVASFSARALPTPLSWVTGMSSSDVIRPSGAFGNRRWVGFGFFNHPALASRQRQYVYGFRPGEGYPPGQSHGPERHRPSKGPPGKDIFLVFYGGGGRQRPYRDS